MDARRAIGSERGEIAGELLDDVWRGFEGGLMWRWRRGWGDGPCKQQMSTLSESNSAASFWKEEMGR